MSQLSADKVELDDRPVDGDERDGEEPASDVERLEEHPAPLAEPGRVCDTRFGNGSDAGCAKAAVGAGHSLNINVTGIDGVPILGSAHSPIAVVINVTAITPSASTFVTVYPGLLGRPGSSDLHVVPSTVATNLVVVGVGSDGTINLFNDLGNINLIVDVLGYYS